MKLMMILFSLLIFSGCSTPHVGRSLSEIKAPRQETLPLTGSFQVNRILFPNGLKLVVIEDHSSPTFAYQTWFNVGSRDEVPGKTGLAHLFEHMMFKETKNLKEGEFDRLLEGAGAQGENAFTSRDYTAYIQEMPASELELIIKAEAERMTQVIVNDQSFKTEREVVQNERRFRTENSPDGIMDQVLFEIAFEKHPYHWPVIGYQKDLDSMTAEDAARFYHTFYAPNHATIVVTGDIKTDEVNRLVEKYYGNLPAQPTPQRPFIAEPIQKMARTRQLKLNVQLEKLMMGYQIPGFNHEDVPILEMIQTILTEGKTNRLRNALVETGIAGSVSSFGLGDRDPSLFVFMVNLQKGKKASQAERVILEQLKKLSTSLVSDQELQRAKNLNQASFYRNLQTNFERAYFLGFHETVGGHFSVGLDHQKRLSAVTAEDVKRVAAKYFQPHSRTVITGVKK